MKTKIRHTRMFHADILKRIEKWISHQLKEVERGAPVNPEVLKAAKELFLGWAANLEGAEIALRKGTPYTAPRPEVEKPKVIKQKPAPVAKVSRMPSAKALEKMIAEQVKKAMTGIKVPA